MTPEQIFAGMPEDLAAAVQAADPAEGANIALAVAVPSCTGCHFLDPTMAAAGPTWYNVGDTAVDHALRAGLPGPAEYLHQSIVAPGSFVVPGFTSGIMPETYDEALSQDDLATLISYLLSLNGQP
jgi:mono/diheme cytochrome c family protein